MPEFPSLALLQRSSLLLLCCLKNKYTLRPFLRAIETNELECLQCEIHSIGRMSDAQALEGGVHGLSGAMSPFTTGINGAGDDIRVSRQLLPILQQLAAGLKARQGNGMHNPRSPLQDPGSGANEVTILPKCPQNYTGCNQKELRAYGVVCPLNTIGTMATVKENGDVCVPTDAMKPIRDLMNNKNVDQVLSEVSMKLHHLTDDAKVQGLDLEGYLQLVTQQFEIRQSLKTRQYGELINKYAVLSGGSSIEEFLNGGSTEAADLMKHYSGMHGGEEAGLAGGELSAGALDVEAQDPEDPAELEALIANLSQAEE